MGSEPVYGESVTLTVKRTIAEADRMQRLTSEEAASRIGTDVAIALGEAGLLPCSSVFCTGLIRWPCVKAAGHTGPCETKLGVYFRPR